MIWKRDLWITQSGEASKLYRLIKTKQRTSGKFVKGNDRAIEWWMEFHLDKCEVVHMGKNGPYFTDENAGHLVSASWESDGVLKAVPQERQHSARHLSKKNKHKNKQTKPHSHKTRRCWEISTGLDREHLCAAS